MELINKLKPENLIENTPFYMIWDTFDRYFQISRDKLLFTSYFSDTIWNVSNGKKEATYIFDLQDKLLQRELQARYDGDSEKYEKQATRYQKINLLETQDKLFIFQKSWAENDLNAIYIHEVKAGTTQKYTGPFIYDDLVSGMELRIRSIHCLDNAIVAAINPIDLLEELEKLNTNDNTEAYDLWKKKMQRVKYDDNPIIVVAIPGSK